MVFYCTRKIAAGLLALVAIFSLVGLYSITRPAVQTVTTLLTSRLVPIYKVDMPEKKVAISFDATWGADQTDELLSILKDNNTKTTFFLAGHWVETYPDYVKKIAAEGHEIGNHSYAHAHMNSLSPDQIRADLQKIHNMLKALTGSDPFLFRPPFGEYGNRLLEEVKALGYYPVQWSIDSLDWKDVTSDFMVERVLGRVGPGDIVLFHNAGKNTVDAVRRLLPELRSQGYTVVPVGDLIYRQDYFIEGHSGMQKSLPKAAELDKEEL